MIKDLKAQVAEWGLLQKDCKQGDFEAFIQYNADENDLAFAGKAPAMFQAVKQLMARVETLENGIKSLGRDLMYEEPSKPIYENDIIRKLTAIIKVPE